MSVGVDRLAFNPALIAASYKRQDDFAPIADDVHAPLPISTPLPNNAVEQGQAGRDDNKDAINQSVEGTNDWLASRNRSIRFRLSENFDRVQVQVVDPKSNRILSTIPSDEMLRFSERIREFAGLGAKVDTSR